MRRDGLDFATTSNSSTALEMTANRGPLSTIALALFGTGSFIAESIANPDAFIYPNRTWEERSAPDSNDGACVALAPLMTLLHTMASYQIGNPIDHCLTNRVYNHDDVQSQVVNFIRALYFNTWDSYAIDDNSRITNAFTAAAFLANEAWLTTSAVNPSWGITYDMGANTKVPIISNTGITAVSALLGLLLTTLLALAAYSAWTPRWTDQLDAFAMLRLGASLAEDIQLRIAHKTGGVTSLDSLPGWIGDASDGNGAVGKLALGGQTSLKGGREYVAYHVDHV